MDAKTDDRGCVRPRSLRNGWPPDDEKKLKDITCASLPTGRFESGHFTTHYRDIKELYRKSERKFSMSHGILVELRLSKSAARV
jgi:hypothetical protein